MQKLLRITAPHFVAGAVFQKRGSVWVCVKSAPIVKYMIGMEPIKIKAYIMKKRWVYEWV